MSLKDEIEACLQQALSPSVLDLWDESDDHKGHAGAAAGGGHFHLIIVSEAFAGQAMVGRHRLVYDAVKHLMHTRIHALSIDAKTPSESL